jgi:hypothetical protein
MKGKLGPAAILLAAALLCSCDRDDQQIKVYRVAKAPLESPPPADASMIPTNSPAPSSITAPSSSSVADVPKSWESQPLSQMRLASFIVRGQNGATADISFVMLGPAAGNILDNVNRWLGQIKQPAVTDEQLRSMVQPLASERGEIAVVDISGEPENGDPNKDGRIIGAIATDETGTAFYKMRGNKDLVGAEKENFVKWVRASRGSAPAQAMVPAPKAPEAPAKADSPSAIKWQAPAGWTSAPPSQMRYASFAVEKNGEKADISVVTFPGEGGSDLDNVNRWRQQIGLAPVDANGLKSMVAHQDAGGVHFDTVDMSGSNARVLAAWTRHGGAAWFFKMTGPPALVEQEKSNFGAFLQSIRF